MRRILKERGPHFSPYAGIDQSLDLGDSDRDIVKRMFIMLGFGPFVVLTLLLGMRLFERLRPEAWG